MGAIEELIKQVPAAAKYRAGLEAMERDNARLKAENEALRRELAQYIEKWETLDGDAVMTLVYLSQCERSQPHEIAAGNKVNPQITESYLRFLTQHAYVQPSADDTAGFEISHKGRRYLHERGLLKVPKSGAKQRAASSAKNTRKRR